MATLENNTGYNLLGASVRVFFGEKVGQTLDVLISEKIIILKKFHYLVGFI